MSRKIEDRTLITYRRLVAKTGNLLAYFYDAEGVKLTGADDILRAALRYDADLQILALYKLEVQALSLKVTWEEYCDARAYWSHASIDELYQSYGLWLAKNPGGEDSFEAWLVAEVDESRFCRYHDC